MNGKVGLGKAIRALREELIEAAREGLEEEKDFYFTFDGAIELTLETSLTTDVDGNVNWSVLGPGASAGAGHERGHTQTLTLRLKPWQRTEEGNVTGDAMIGSVSEGDKFGRTCDGPSGM